MQVSGLFEGTEDRPAAAYPHEKSKSLPREPNGDLGAGLGKAGRRLGAPSCSTHDSYSFSNSNHGLQRNSVTQDTVCSLHGLLRVWRTVATGIGQVTGQLGLLAPKEYGASWSGQRQ